MKTGASRLIIIIMNILNRIMCRLILEFAPMQYKLIRFYGPTDAWELYDLEKDPAEMKNMYMEKKDSRLVISLKTQLKSLISQYHDDEAMHILEKESN